MACNSVADFIAGEYSTMFFFKITESEKVKQQYRIEIMFAVTLVPLLN